MILLRSFCGRVRIDPSRPAGIPGGGPREGLNRVAEGRGESRAARQGSGRAPSLVPARRLSGGPASNDGGGANHVGARKVSSAPLLPTLRRVPPIPTVQPTAADDGIGHDVQSFVVPLLSILAAIVVAYVVATLLAALVGRVAHR